MKDTLINDIKLANSIIEEQRTKIIQRKDQLLKLLVEENGIKINDEFIIRNTKVYVCDTVLKTFNKNVYEVRYLTKKIKKNGEKGSSWDNSWGYNAKDLKEIK